ncbi:MAG: acyl-CoA dehydrogenase family protein [SAR86 cluster bacterium]|nr:acyl-CoA dehydrogenase family protein [SAR86 cluster bacterium]
MDIEFTKKQQKLRFQLREYFDDLLNKDLKKELTNGLTDGGGGPEFKKALKKIGKDGWIGLSWPKKYGGQERSTLDQYIFTEEVMRSGFPFPFLTTESVGPTIAEYGNKKIKDEIIPQILAGEIVIAIGYSEQNAGTDLASLTTKAEKKDNSWLINGQKMWTSLADYSDYIWLAVRTDPQSNDHKGLSMMLVPSSCKGITINPIFTLGDVRTNTTFYDDVKIPQKYLIGEINQGWKLITGQLNRERVSLVNNAPIERALEEVINWAKLVEIDQKKMLIDEPWVQNNLAKVKVGADALRILCWKQACALDKEELHMADASVVKVYGSEFFIEAYRLLMEVLGIESLLTKNSEGRIIEGRLEMLYRVSSILTFGGGTNEIQRDIISMAGLSMPRQKR